MNPTPAKTWTVMACLPNIDTVCCELSQWLVEQGLVAQLFPMELLAREALNNAMVHGNLLNPTSQVQCEVQNIADTLRLHVKDDGNGFNWQNYLQREIADADNESGRGIQLYRLYADSVEFNQCGNQVSLVRMLRSEGKENMEIKPENKVDMQRKQFFCPETDLTSVKTSEIRAQLKALIGDGVEELVVDLANTRVIDSAGIGLLVAAHNSLRRVNGRMSLVNVSQDLLDLLKAFRLDKHFSITGDPRLG